MIGRGEGGVVGIARSRLVYRGLMANSIAMGRSDSDRGCGARELAEVEKTDGGEMDA